MKVLEVRDLKKSYKKGFIPRRQSVLKGISFSLAPGTITGFLGANGAGKTTTMKCILGLAFADSGQVSFFDGKALSPSVKNRIGFLPERPYFYEYLTGTEFLRFYGQLSTQISRGVLNERIEKMLKRVDLYHARDQRLRSYSKGMLQKIGLAQSLLHEPELVILDEPMSGLDPDGRYYLAELIRSTAQQGAAVFFSSHHIQDTERLCQNLVMIKDGTVIYEGETSVLLDRMGVTVDVTYAKGGERLVSSGLDHAGAQAVIRQRVAEGCEIFEVRSVRKSLEEVYIKMALKGGHQ